MFQAHTYLVISKKKSKHDSWNTFGVLFFKKKEKEKNCSFWPMSDYPNFGDQALAAVPMQKSEPSICVNSQYAEIE